MKNAPLWERALAAREAGRDPVPPPDDPRDAFVRMAPAILAAHGPGVLIQPAPGSGTQATSQSAPRPGARPRGFAAMDPAYVSRLARTGGKMAHAMGRAHQFTLEEAREAGRRGGLTTAARKRAARAASGA